MCRAREGQKFDVRRMCLCSFNKLLFRILEPMRESCADGIISVGSV